MVLHHFIVIVLLLFCCVTSFANTVTIRNSEDFVKLLDQASKGDFNYDIVLETDLDFNKDPLMGVVDKLPLGSVNDSYCIPYVGTFDGKGHVVKNLKTTNNQYAGLICDVSGVIIKNITIDGSCVFKGNYAGALSVNVSGDVTLQSVQIYSTVEFIAVGGGMLGWAYNSSKTSKIIIENCEFEGSIIRYGIPLNWSYFGGFIGFVCLCNNLVVQIQRNVNNGRINSTMRMDEESNFSDDIGGYIGGLTGNTNITIFVCNNVNHMNIDIFERRKASPSVGGFSGCVQGTNVALIIENNINHILTNISSNGGIYYGGFVGFFPPTNGTLIVKNNTNDGVFSSSFSGSSISIGGYVGYISDGVSHVSSFHSNSNNLKMFVESNSSWSYELSGYVAHFSPSVSKYIHFYDNVNNGFVSAIGPCTQYGGFAALLVSSSSNPNEPVSIKLINNTNNANAFFNSGVFDIQHSLGGLIGFFPSSNNCNFDVENNSNNGSIEGLFGTGPFYVAGLVGSMPSNSHIKIRGNTNNGFINITNNDPLTKTGFAAGIIGFDPYSYEHEFTDNANYGQIATNSIGINGSSCGLICVPDTARGPFVRNVVNNATIQGINAYGVSNRISNADNVVSAGKVIGSALSYSFWYYSNSTPTLCYALDDSCKHCDVVDDVVLFAKNTIDGRYHTTNSENSLVDELLNEEAEKNAYRKRWDHNLYLRRQVSLRITSPLNLVLQVLSGLSLEENDVSDKAFVYHLIEEGVDPTIAREYSKKSIIEDDIVLVPYYKITVSGEMERTIYVTVDGKHSLGDSESGELKKYLTESKDYAVGDSDDNTVLNTKTVVSGDMNIVVMKRHVVVIEMKEGTKVKVNSSEIAEIISAMAGVDSENILIVIETDEEGNILRIIVILKTDEMSSVVVKSVNDLAKKDGQCEYGVLCRALEARVFVEGQSVSTGSRVPIQFGIPVFFLVLFISWILL